MRPFFGVTSKKKSSCLILQALETNFWSQTTFDAIFTRILSRFSTNQNIWGCACTPASYATVLQSV